MLLWPGNATFLCSASFMPCLSVFHFLHCSSVGGFCTHYLQRQSHMMVSHFSAFPKYQLSLRLLKALNLKLFTVKKKIDKGGEWCICWPGLHNKWPHTEGFLKKTHKCLLSQSWRLEVQNQGVNSVGSNWRPWRKYSLPCSFSATGGCQQSLVFLGL